MRTLPCRHVKGVGPDHAGGDEFSDQARVLVDHLLKAASYGTASFRGKHVIELGAGTGLVGLALAAAGEDAC